MISGFWKTDNEGCLLLSLPVSLGSKADILSVFAYQSLNGPKYLGLFGLSETPAALKVSKIENSGQGSRIFLSAELADTVNFTKPIHVTVCNGVGAELAACECLPKGAIGMRRKVRRASARSAALVVGALAVTAAGAGLALQFWPEPSETHPSPAQAVVAPAAASPPAPKTESPPKAETWSRQRSEEEAEKAIRQSVPGDMLTLGRTLHETGAADLAAALFRRAGDVGMPEGWLELARLYDPQVSGRTPLLSRDPKIAHFYYRRAATAGIGTAESEDARLIAWLRQRAATGEASAIKILQDINP